MYRVSQRAEGNTAMGFYNEQMVDGGSEEYLATNLSGGVSYEFVVAAENEFGLGPFSRPSLCIRTKQLSSGGNNDNTSFVQQQQPLPPLDLPSGQGEPPDIVRYRMIHIFTSCIHIFTYSFIFIFIFTFIFIFPCSYSNIYIFIFRNSYSHLFPYSC